MSYACIDREELDRRGFCDGVSCEPPSIIRETIFEPIMEPIFESDPFVPSFLRGGSSRFGGGGSGGQRHGRLKGGRRPWQPRHQQVLQSGSDSPSTAIMRPQTSSYSRAPGKQTSRAPVYRARAGQAATPSLAPRPTQYTTRRDSAPASRNVPRQAPTYRAASTPRQTATAPTSRRGNLKGFGQTEASSNCVIPLWKYATFGLTALLIVQAAWWINHYPKFARR